MKTQRQRVIEILERDGRIDNWYAIDTRLSTRLSDHINELRNAGWEIETEILENKNCVYRLVKLPVAKQLQLV